MSILFLLSGLLSINAQKVELCDGLIKLSADAQHEDYIEWWVNGQYVGGSYNLTLLDTGVYKVEAYAYNAGCLAKVTLTVQIIPCKDCPIYTPNAVRNGAYFTPKSLCWFEFEIFNRWGENLHRGSEPWLANVQNDVYTVVVYGKGYIYRGVVVVVE